jgi:hypothetical protein
VFVFSLILSKSNQDFIEGKLLKSPTLSSGNYGCTSGSSPFSGFWREGIYEETTTGSHSALSAKIMIRERRDPWVYLYYLTNGELEFSQVCYCCGIVNYDQQEINAALILTIVSGSILGAYILCIVFCVVPLVVLVVCIPSETIDNVADKITNYLTTDKPTTTPNTTSNDKTTTPKQTEHKVTPIQQPLQQVVPETQQNVGMQQSVQVGELVTQQPMMVQQPTMQNDNNVQMPMQKVQYFQDISELLGVPEN